MGNASAKRSQTKGTEIPISSDSAAPVAEPSFSNGELGQIQEILFGAQQRSTNELISTLQLQVSDQIQTLSNVLNSRINQLTESVEKIASAHEQKLSELEAEQTNSAKSLNCAVEDNHRQLETSITLLGKNSGEENAKVQNAIESVEAQLKSQLRETQESLTTKINASLDQLQSSKLDKQNLAQMLSEVSERITTSDTAGSK